MGQCRGRLHGACGRVSVLALVSAATDASFLILSGIFDSGHPPVDCWRVLPDERGLRFSSVAGPRLARPHLCPGTHAVRTGMTMTTLAFFAGPSAQAHSAHDGGNRRRLCPKAWAAPGCTTPSIRREGQPAARGYANPLGVRSAAAGAAVKEHRGNSSHADRQSGCSRRTTGCVLLTAELWSVGR